MADGRKTKRSQFYEYFELITDSDGTKKYVCKICSSNPTTAKKGRLDFKAAPSNLGNHLKNVHKGLGGANSEDESEAGQSELTDNLTSHPSQSSVHSSKKRKSYPSVASVLSPALTIAQVENCNYELISMITGDFQPLSIVENSRFKRFCNSLNSSFRIPARNTVQKLLEKQYETVKKFLIGFITRASDISLTTDAWKSQANKQFLGVTAHFIIDNELYNCSLGVLRLKKTETSANIKEYLQTLLASWGISNEKLVCCVTDNARNMINSITELGVQRLPCFGHLINLCVKDAIENAE